MFGDPERIPHPIVYMGKWISFWEHRLNKGRYRKAKGAVVALSSITLTFALAYYLLQLLSTLAPSLMGRAGGEASWGWASWGETFIIFFCLAGHTLRKEVRMVFEAVDRSVEDGRRQVARIVGRDTSELTAQECRTAALETLAENLSDGVIAPLFWFAILGVPGMLAYKMINTLDSMIGYQNPRYKDFGCWAAHIDDAANYIPARLSALLIIISSKLIPNSLKSRVAPPRPLTGEDGNRRRGSFSFTLHYGPQHASPNSGWPEAALASVLDCRFGGPHNYFGELFYKPYIGDNPRPLTTDDMRLSIRIMLIAECIMVAAIVIISTILTLYI